MTLLRRARIRVAELARIMGEHPDALRRLLKAQSVPLHQPFGPGTPLWVWPDELAMHAPDTYRAIDRLDRIRAAIVPKAKTGT